MDKRDKEQIKRLKAEKKYEEIFISYGKEAYKKYVPKKYKKQDLKKLKSEGKYEAIYNKYGEGKYNSLLIKAMYDDIKYNSGILKAILWKVKQKTLNMAKAFGLVTTVLTLEYPIMNYLDSIDNSIKYESEIEGYDISISNYAKKIKSMNLTDTQIFMKAIDDMWGNIKGYRNPEKNIRGFLELDLATPEGYGVCRNMASDIAKKLNKINSEYNARTVVVEMGEDGRYYIANIDRAIYDEENIGNYVQHKGENITKNVEEIKTVEENEDKNKKETIESIVNKVVGNHMVTFVDLKKYNLIIVLDPTNPSIGIYINGQIIMLNSPKKMGIEYEMKGYSTAIAMNTRGLKGIEDTVKDYKNSYKTPKLSFKEIEELFGLKAQNKALDEVRNMKENSFKQSIRIDLDNQQTLQISTNSRDIDKQEFEIEDKEDINENIH